MTNSVGSVQEWYRRAHRGVVAFDGGEVVQIFSKDIGAARRRPAWRGAFELRSGDRVECVRDANGRVVDVVRLW